MLSGLHDGQFGRVNVQEYLTSYRSLAEFSQRYFTNLLLLNPMDAILGSSLGHG